MHRPPAPFRQFVLKVHSRCDLACDHCYVYTHADSGWRRQPTVMPDDVLRRTSHRIAEHAVRHRLRTVHVVLHGGEPLLAGPARLRRVCEELRNALPPGCGLDLRIHTNGMLLDEEFCALFDQLGVGVGLSVDGDRTANDRHRRYADGRSSHTGVLAAIALLRRPRFRHLYTGLLCTVDVANDPVAVFDALAELEPPSCDFLLPHATWDSPPAGDGSATPYADWMLTVHDRWEAAGRPVRIRVFESVRRTLIGQTSRTEAFGLDPADLVVVETDGSIEQADSLKTAFDGAPATGLDVFGHSFDEAAAHPGIALRQAGSGGLCTTCRACPVVHACGGGLYAHRYRTGSGFDNPSVYCADLKELVTGLARRTGAPTVTTREPPPAPVLTDGELDELARGPVGGATQRRLDAAQLDLTRRLLAGAARVGDTEPWELLTVLDQTAPEAVDAVLRHPYVRAWAVRWLQDGSGAASAVLAAVAAAAAVRAGCDFEIEVAVRRGAVHLPTVGRMVVDGGGRAVVRRDQAGVTVAGIALGDRHRGTALWQPRRRLAGAEGWGPALEDSDPERECHGRAVAQRLGPTALASWTGALRQAWEVIRADLPSTARAVAGGLRTLTPLVPNAGGRQVHAAARHAYGALALPLAADGTTLAARIVRGFRTVTFHGVLDLHALCAPADGVRLPSPWRSVPCPPESLLADAHSALAVVEFWGARAGSGQVAGGGPADTARLRLAVWRTRTCQGLTTLAASQALTPAGRRFTERMQEALEPWLVLPLGPTAEALGRATEVRHGR